MKTPFRSLLAAAGFLSAALASAAPGPGGPAPGNQARDGGFRPGEVLVQLRSAGDLPKLTRDYHTPVLSRAATAPAFRLAVPGGTDPGGLLARLRADARVMAADPNQDVGTVESPSPGEPVMQWTSAFDGGTGPRLYSGQPAIEVVNYSRAASLADGNGILVAVLDTGISPRHPSLARQTLPGWNFVDDNARTDDIPVGLDIDGDGKKDAAAGHGTVVAGIVSRFAPRAKLLPVKVLNSDGWGSIWSVSNGIRYATARGAKVINLSLGFQMEAEMLNKALQEATDRGVLVVTSAGNRNTDRPQFPAANSRAMVVAALNNNKTKASFSNYGSVVSVSAPGVDVVSTYWDGRFVAWSGTSFSTPFAVAEAALVRQIVPLLRWDKVQKLIERTSQDVDAFNPNFAGQLGRGGGLVDFDAAVLAAKSGRVD